MWVLSMELAACHPSGTEVFEIGPRIFGKYADLNHGTYMYLSFFHIERSGNNILSCVVCVCVLSCLKYVQFVTLCNSLKKPHNELGISHY